MNALADKPHKQGMPHSDMHFTIFVYMYIKFCVYVHLCIMYMYMCIESLTSCFCYISTLHDQPMCARQMKSTKGADASVDFS